MGSRGRCFFTAAGSGDVAEAEVEAGEGTPGEPLVAEVAAGWAEAAGETRLRAAGTACCKASFRLGADSRDGAAAAADEGGLPEQKTNNKCEEF